jgi:hypothetical protein
MSDLAARPIAGIDGTYAVINPVFSPLTAGQSRSIPVETRR